MRPFFFSGGKTPPRGRPAAAAAGDGQGLAKGAADALPKFKTILFKSLKVAGKVAAAVTAAGLKELPFGATVADVLTGLAEGAVFQIDAMQSADKHTKEARKKMQALLQIASELTEASFPAHSPDLESLVEACASLAELVAKWNGYGPWKRALSLSCSTGTTNAAKYAARFEALFALLDLHLAAVLRQVAVESFAGIADLQRHAELEASETRRAFSAAALAQGMVLDDVRTLEGQLEALSLDLAGLERGLAEVGEKVDQVSDKVDDVMSEIGKIYSFVSGLPPLPRTGGATAAPEGVLSISRGSIKFSANGSGRLGRGAHGFVLKADLVAGARVLPVAVKTVDLGDPGAAAAVTKELTVLGKLRHRNIVHLLGACCEEASMFVVLELCPFGGLDGVLRVFAGHEGDHSTQERSAAMLAAAGGNALGLAGASLVAEARRRLGAKLGGPLGAGANAAFFRVARGVTAALLYLHSQGIVHGDVKPANVLLDARGHPRLSDFGLARSLGTARTTDAGGGGGTAGFMAPEVLETGRTSAAGDVFSLAMVLPEVLSGGDPFAHLGANAMFVNVAVLQGKRPDIAGAPPAIAALLPRMWDTSPRARPSAVGVAAALEAAENDGGNADCAGVGFGFGGGGGGGDLDGLRAVLRAHQLDDFFGALRAEGFVSAAELMGLAPEVLRQLGTAAGMKFAHLARFEKLAKAKAQCLPTALLATSQPSTDGSTMVVGGLETTVVSIGPGGDLLRRGSQKPLDEVEQVFLVIDPRSIENIADARHRQTLAATFPPLLAKLKLFVLLPSTTSSPECLLRAEVSLQSLSSIFDILGPTLTKEVEAAADATQGGFRRTRGEETTAGAAALTSSLLQSTRFLHAVRLDDYQQRGYEVLAALVESGKRVYPAEEAEAMLGLISPRAELAYCEEGCLDIVASSRLDANVYRFRAWTHLAVGYGVEECQIPAPLAGLFCPLLSEPSLALPNLGGRQSSVDTGHLHPVAGSRSRPEFIAFRAAAAVTFSQAIRFPVNTWDDPGHNDGRLEQEAPAQLGRGLRGGPKRSHPTYPVLFIERDDFATAESCATVKRALRHIGEDGSYSSAMIIFLFDSFEALASPSSGVWVVPTLHLLRDAFHFSEVLCFATRKELPQFGRLFRPRDADEHVVNVISTMCPFSDLNVFTLGTALGQKLDGSTRIIVPALSVGGRSGIPEHCFAIEDGPLARNFLSNASFEPLTERVLPGSGLESNEVVTVIQPLKILLSAFEAMSAGFKTAVVTETAMLRVGGVQDSSRSEEQLAQDLEWFLNDRISLLADYSCTRSEELGEHSAAGMDLTPQGIAEPRLPFKERFGGY